MHPKRKKTLKWLIWKPFHAKRNHSNTLSPRATKTKTKLPLPRKRNASENVLANKKTMAELQNASKTKKITQPATIVAYFMKI
jgi:hypothetical protein